MSKQMCRTLLGENEGHVCRMSCTCACRVQLVTVQGSRTEMVEAAVKAVRARVLKVPSHGGT